MAMAVNDQFELTGALQIRLNDEVVKKTNNTVVLAGKKWVARRMKDTDTVMTHMAVGTGTAAVNQSDTALGSELDRNALSVSGGTVANNTITYESTWAAGDGTGAITEAGIFDASSGGDLLARTKFDLVNKGANDSMTITWTITVS